MRGTVLYRASSIVLVSLTSTTRRKRSVLTLEKKLEIIGELKKGKSLRCVSGLYDVPKSTAVSHSHGPCDIWKDREKIEKHMTASNSLP